MSKKLSGILTIVAGIIGFVAFYFFIRIVMVGDETLETDAAEQASIISPFISFAQFILIATAVIAVVFSIINLIMQPEVLKRSFIALGIIAVLIAISYSFASDAAVTDGLGKVIEYGEPGSISKWVSTGINFSAILGVIGLGFFVVDFGRSLVK